MAYVATNAARQMGVFYPPPYGAPFRAVRRPRIGMAAMGMGQGSAQEINSIVTTGASTTVGILTAVGTLGGPVGAAVAGLIAVGSLIASMFKGCGSSCIIASQDANKFEPPLQQNLSTYMNAPVHYASLQAAALNNVDTLFAALRQACSDPSLGDPGVRCISERLDASACHWKNDGHGGPAGSGNVCWNWVVGYRDPIANDPSVVPDPTVSSVAQTVSTGAQNLIQAVTGGGSGPAGSFNYSGLLLPGGLALLGLLLFSLGGGRS